MALQSTHTLLRCLMMSILMFMLAVILMERMAAAADEVPTKVTDVVPPSSTAEKQPELTTQFERVNAQVDGWDTEVFSEKSMAQLQRITDVLSRPLGDDMAEVAELAADEFQCMPLRPPSLKLAFADECFRVNQFRLNETDNSPTDNSQMVDLVTALVGLRKPFDRAEQIRTKIKVVGVHRNADLSTTTVIYNAYGGHHEHEGSVQQWARWRCHWRANEGETCELIRIEVLQFEEVTSTPRNRTAFADCTEAVIGNSTAYRQQLCYGTDHWRRRLDRLLGISAKDHNGLAVGDINGDGLDDLYICQAGGLPNRLFVQNADGTATDMSADYGVDYFEPTYAALILDLDNDGDQDMALSMYWGTVFLKNNGAGKFSLSESRLREFIDNWDSAKFSIPGALAAADYDNDGDLDVYVCYYAPSGMHADGDPPPLPYHDANNGARNVLLRNDGEFRFVDVTESVGVDVNNRRFSFAASWADYDNDGDQDLYVANDFGRNNLYQNEGGRFIDVASRAGVEDIAAGMSVSWGDFNGDGWLDLYVSNMFSSAGNRIAYQRRFKDDSTDATRKLYQRHARGNTLFANNGDGTFSDVSVEAGVTMGRWAWSSNFFDMNNDGLLDILVANGYITQEDTGDL